MSSPASRQFAQHVRVSSTDELSYASSAKGEINETIQTIVTGRKCWKTMKGKGEVVWPPYLEAALVEGLEKYQPVESRTTRAFGRFPMRNKFISDYIFQRTGKRRTPKQVGSRLQQLRDTTEGKRILQLLSSRHIAMMQPKAERSPEQLPSSASSSGSSIPPGPPCSYVSIDVCPDSEYTYSPDPSPSLTQYSHAQGQYRTQAPRPLRALDPTVTFVSRCALQHAYSAFRVVRRDMAHSSGMGNGTLHGQAQVFAERTDLMLHSSSMTPARVWPSQMECSFLYRTPFVPGFWRALVECGDPTPYTIVQDIVRFSGNGNAPGDEHNGKDSPGGQEEVLLTVVYSFNLVHGQTRSSLLSPPLSPAHSVGTFSAESSPELGSELNDYLLYNNHTLSSTASASAPSLPLPPVHSLHHMSSSGSLEPALSSLHSSPHASGGRPGTSGGYSSAATPQLVQAGDDGYASLPPSPLDLTFAHGVQEVGVPAMSAMGMCGNAYGVEYHSHHAGPAVYTGEGTHHAHTHASMSQYNFDASFGAV
ncbi:uncharacterized protein LAESUDRAFT_727724 [Laetiporus sulphureus 93-53]|uniref:TEA domain-containing protein n=1 Tax=Laetiporus sulphureus 93-53 TaxID=1314785 RepID=A0A165DGX5_9APHY|nr:uncharacterized protein LAESUDRAFT_727724 [Laetiporus sulphureus 93-53]KZT04855.1 hypothetical protein LAESUDRAFT_727724 [Laetiporus sulphureus 93-53]